MPRNYAKLPANAEMDECIPSKYAEFAFQSVCDYVKNQTDLCDGGGYILWTELKVCTENPTLQILVVIAALVFFVYLFVHLSATADDFFCENIAAITDYHHISQNLAGITFMAFGNGAPDIFSSIASVISVKNPQASLAISELLGGGIFVTTVVIATIVLAKPFTMVRRPLIRDIGFYLLALALLAFVVFTDSEIHFWQPIMFLGLYSVYAAVVVLGNVWRQRLRKEKRRKRLHVAIARCSGFLPKKRRSKRSSVAPIEDTIFPKLPGYVSEQDLESKIESPTTDLTTIIITPQPIEKSPNRVECAIYLPGKRLVIPVDECRDGDADDTSFVAEEYLESGKFFAKEELDERDETDDTDSPSPIKSETVTPSASSSPMPSVTVECSRLMCCRRVAYDLASQFCPLDRKRFAKARWPGKIYRILKIPSVFLLTLTVPLANREWCKPLTAIHVFLAPIVFCINFQLLGVFLFDYLPLWELVVALSVLLCVMVVLFTSIDKEPKCYRLVASYAGFIMSIAWIYATAAEVVNVMLMFGNLFGISYQILGLTAVSWCNSIGDLIADFSVAKKGSPRMAFSAAIGGPLFNLMVGFGTTFTIAKLQGKTVLIAADSMEAVMFIALAISLGSTLVLLIVQRFHTQRFYSFYLIFLYVVFLIFALLASQHIF